ncbi:MAG: hypothetical protein O3B01_30765 [Planctomycetota bacterium]|nr:hypothetical protein [Planctomycetota bacterium]MDA1142966.1 hypothetical protein [Planctomycetota bacterium]
MPLLVSPRITAPDQPDNTDIRRFVDFWSDQSMAERAESIWRYLCDEYTGVYHFWQCFEGRDDQEPFANCRDPLKLLNVHGHIFCGIAGRMLENLLIEAGAEEARSVGIDTWNHCFTEAYYDNAWHYLDVDVRGALRNKNGDIASLHEVMTQAELWTDPPHPIEPFFPKDHDKAKLAEIYNLASPCYEYHFSTGHHSWDHLMRPGEQISCFWQPQGHRWDLRPEYVEKEYPRTLLQAEPVGLKPNRENWSAWNYGNAHRIYEPDLSDSTLGGPGNGILQSMNSTPAGLQVKGEEGKWEFDWSHPYMFVGELPDPLKPNSEKALTVSLTGNGKFKLYVSGDEGRRWHEAGHGELSRTPTLDLTPWVQGCYRCRFRLCLSGGTLLEKWHSESWHQLAPRSLPRLHEGTNERQLGVGDRWGKMTTVTSCDPDTRFPDETEPWFAEPPGHYEFTQLKKRFLKPVSVSLSHTDALPIDWFRVGASLRSHHNPLPGQNHHRIDYQVNGSEDWLPIEVPEIPSWVHHWHTRFEEDVCLGTPIEKLKVRFEGQPGLNRFSIRAHGLLPTESWQNAKAEVTHVWEEDGERKAFEKTVEPDETYNIKCGPTPKDFSYRIRVPHA